METIPNGDPKKTMRAYGQAAILVGISLTLVAQTIHTSPNVALGLAIASVIASLSGLVLAFKAARPERRVNILLAVVAGLVALTVCTLLVLHR